MDKKFSFSGIASNPASGINNIDLNVAGADGAGMSSDSSGVTKKEMISLLQKVVHAENGTLGECKTDLEEIIERVTRPEYKKRISQIITAIDMAQDPRKKTKDPSTGQYDPTAQELASRMMRKLSHLENEEEHKNQHTAGNKTMSFNNREAQVKKKKKTRGNPFRVLMGKVGKLLDHGIEKKDIVRYLAKQKFWGNETIERAVDIVRDYNKKKKNDSEDDKEIKEEKKDKKASTEVYIKIAGLDYDAETDWEKRSTAELIYNAYYLDGVLEDKDSASKENASAEFKKIKTELKKRGESLEDLDLG
jgi:hypothetical protein